MEKNRYTYYALINALQLSERWEEVLQIIKELSESGKDVSNAEFSQTGLRKLATPPHTDVHTAAEPHTAAPHTAAAPHGAAPQ